MCPSRPYQRSNVLSPEQRDPEATVRQKQKPDFSSEFSLFPSLSLPRVAKSGIYLPPHPHCQSVRV